MIAHRTQRGMSLISLMAGLLISMIAILAMMGLFNGTLKNTLAAVQDSRLTSERSSGVLITSVLAQSAGFGIASATPQQHLLLLNNATVVDGRLRGTSTSQQGNALLWETQLADGTYCAGIFAPTTETERGLYELPARRCSSLSNTLDTAWQARALITDRKPGAASFNILFSLRYYDSDSPCKALGIAGSGGVSLTVSIEASGGHPVNSTTCLLNFSATESV